MFVVVSAAASRSLVLGGINVVVVLRVVVISLFFTATCGREDHNPQPHQSACWLDA